MGGIYQAVCLDCSHAFHARGGGGFEFIELHCSLCGQLETLSCDLIQKPLDLHNRAIADGIDSIRKLAEELQRQTTERLSEIISDREQLNHLKEAITEATDDFDEAIRPIVGECNCGGRFSLYAPVRCPACKSANIQKGEVFLHYD